MQQRNTQRGFTLIELMIVVAIIGILAAVALPQYVDYVSRSRWSDTFAAIGAVKAAAGECLQNQNGDNAAPVDCADFNDGGALEQSGYLPANWAGLATPKFATGVPTIAASGTTGITISVTGNNQAGGCTVMLVATANSNQLRWDFLNDGVNGCNRAKTGVGT